MISSGKFRQLFLAASTMLVPLALPAQQDFRQISAQSLSLARAGNWDGAIITARRGLASCLQGTAGKQCRALLNYTMGFVQQEQGESSVDPGRAREALAGARRLYEASLADDPENGAVLFNLALLLQKSGELPAAFTSLQKAINADPPRASEYGVKLGDIYTQNNDIGSAWNAYENAAKSAPGAETPRWRMVGLMSRAALPSSKLQSLCQSWEPAFPDIAAACYEQVVKASYKDNGLLAEQNFLAWLTLRSDSEQLTEESLAVLPNQWNTGVVDNVRAILRASIPPSVPDWWRGSIDRRRAYATLMLLAGRRFASHGPKFVETCWRAGIDAVQHLLEPPQGGRYPLTPGVTLNLYQELALLYIRYPDFDPQEGKLKQLIVEIFAEKGLAIASHNLEAEQRFHTILGMIFVQQKNWGYDGDPHSAAYQLLRTVQVADQRYQEEGVYQPLPEIKELQVSVYRATNQPEKANQSLWNAALAYMDSDQLDRAALVINETSEAAGMDKVSLTRLLQLRRQAASGSVTPDLVAQYQSLAGKPGIGAEFLKRQQFKILGDLVSTSSDVHDQSTLQRALDAFDLTTKQGVPLIGVGDLKRWQAVQQSVLRSVGGQVKEGPIRAPGHVSGTPLKMTLPGRTSSQTVEVPQTTVQAAQIARAIGPENLVQMRSRLVYDGNTLSMPAEKLDNAQVRERLKAAGVRVVPQ